MDVSIDNYLDIISVPILYIGAGGDGEAGYIIPQQSLAFLHIVVRSYFSQIK